MNYILHNAAILFNLHPAPWKFRTTDLDGYVVDANNITIFGGEAHEGYVSESDPDIVYLVDTINSIAAYMKGDNSNG